MRLFLFFSHLFLAAVLFATAPAQAQHSGHAGSAATAQAIPQQVPAEAMARAGLTRVDDLFWFLDGWNAPSLDGYATRPSADGLPGAPLLVVGGQPLKGGPFGLPPLAVLPVHLAQVRSARASTVPQFASGRLALDGAVHLRLRPPGRGFGARAAFSAGNEVGDPGPFRSTALRVRNVDRIGPQYFGEARWGGPRTSARFSLRALRHYTTDAAIRPRVEHLRDSSGGPPLQQLVAPRLVLETNRLGRHRLHAQYANLRALPFFETLGYEVPTRRQHTQMGLEGEAPPLPGLPGRLRYRASYTYARAASDEDRIRTTDLPGVAFDAAEHRLGGDVSLGALPLGPLRLSAGLSADYTRASDPLRDPTLLTTRAYAQFSRATRSSSVQSPELRERSASGIRPRLTLLLSQTDGQIGGGAVASGIVPLGPGQQLSARASYLHRPYAEGGPRWYWLAQGRRVPTASANRVTLPPSFSTSDRFTADVRLQQAFEGGGHVGVTAGIRHFRNLTLPRTEYGYDPAGGGLVPALDVRTDAGGQTFLAALEAERTFPAGLHHRLRYDAFVHRNGGSTAFEQRFARTPRNQVRYTARLAVDDRFSLEGRFTVRSPERWPAYRRAAQAGPYRSRLPAYGLLDITATKRFWKDHLRLRLALRNLLDAPLRTHPAGPVRRLTLFLSLEAQL